VLANHIGRLLGLVALFSALVVRTQAQCGAVSSATRITSGLSGFTGTLHDGDTFGYSLANLGDLDGDGVDDVAVGAPFAPGGGVGRGAVWILFFNSDGTVKVSQLIDDVVGGFAGVLDDYDGFGFSVASLGDISGDGLPELAVGAFDDDDGGQERGAVWILFMRADGTVWAQWKISSTSGGLIGPLHDGDQFGSAAAAIGDLDGDGLTELAVGAPGDDDGNGDAGAAWLLFLNPNGTVRAEQKISATSGNLPYVPSVVANLGRSVSSLGDIDDDGLPDICVGLPHAGTVGTGEAWILFLNPTGTVKGAQRLGTNLGGLSSISPGFFGEATAGTSDINCDGTSDLVIGAPFDQEGAAYAVFLKPDGTALASYKIGESAGTLPANLNLYDYFGGALVPVQDFDGNGVLDLLVGAPFDDTAGPDRGAVWLLRLECPSASAASRNGTGVNSALLANVTLPVLGASWRLDINCIGHAPSLAYFLVYGSPVTGPIIGAGEILVGGQFFFRTSVAHSGNVRSFIIPVPNDPALCGLAAYTQGVCFGNPGAKLSNAIDVVLGR